MKTYEFNIICDGADVHKESLVNCQTQFSTGEPYRSVTKGEIRTWLIARNEGWREAKWRGKTRHLCPNCWADFIERRK